MANLLFSLLESKDPEERLENAMLWKALKDVYGPNIHALSYSEEPGDGDMIFGLPPARQMEASRTALPRDYWNWEAFRSRISREFGVYTLEEAEQVVDDMNARGKEVFLKATSDKFYTERAKPGASLYKTLGDMVYSFCDIEIPCLMVQEAVDFTHEYRCVIVNGKVVTGSPVVFAATPMARMSLNGENAEGLLFRSPADPFSAGQYAGPVVTQMKRIANEMAADLKMVSGTIDLGLIGGDSKKIEPIEINSGYPGRYGLYFADPVKIAKASVEIVPEHLLSPERNTAPMRDKMDEFRARMKAGKAKAMQASEDKEYGEADSPLEFDL